MNFETGEFGVAWFWEGPGRSRVLSRALSCRGRERARDKNRERPGPSENQAKFGGAMVPIILFIFWWDVARVKIPLAQAIVSFCLALLRSGSPV